MNPVKDFYLTTKELIQLIEEKKVDDRVKRIAEIERLLAKRDACLKEVKKPLTDGEKILAQQAVQLNEKLVILLNEEKIGIQQDIRQLNIKKESNRKYVNPYASLQTDGAFFDKRK